MQVLSALLLSVLIVRVVALFLTPLGLQFDEAQYWAWSLDPAFGYYTKPPLIAWLIGATTAICGDSPECIRFPAGILHIGTAILCYVLGRRLYDWTVGFWSAVAYALLPGVSVSSFLITTDVPLIFCWVIALIAFEAHLRRPTPSNAVLLGLSIGAGLNAKYAMIFFPLSAALYIVATRSARPLLRSSYTALAAGIAALLIVPNLIWNINNGSATFRHVYEDNMEWQGVALHPVDALEFLGSQFGLAGPIVFGAYIVILFTGRRTEKPPADRFLLFFSLPVLILITAQALLSGAEANWSATAFPAMVVLTTAHLVLPRHRRSFLGSLAINGLVAAVVTLGIAAALPTRVTGLINATHQFFTADELRANLPAILRAADTKTVVADTRTLSAELVYALRGTAYDVRARAYPNRPPSDGFQMSRPWTPQAGTDTVAYIRPAGLGPPDDFPAQVSRVGSIDSPSISARYGTLDIWRVTLAQ